MTWKTLNERAYTPYSGNPRSCVVVGKTGKAYAGVRIENVSFPLTIAAVQAAVSLCLSEADVPAKIVVPFKNFDQLDYWATEFNCEIDVQKELDAFDFADYQRAFPSQEEQRLKQLLEQAVIPNSDFPVSAILYSDQACFEGVNVESTDWGLGLCAERVALTKALSSGVRKFKRIAVHTKKGEFCSPCGACRQVLIEHMPLEKVELNHADGTFSEHFVLDFLPFSFTSKDLRK
jgi:homotetrameric cytidine deaminase